MIFSPNKTLPKSLFPKLKLLQVFILISLPVTAFNNIFNISKYFNIYPYLLMAILFFIAILPQPKVNPRSHTHHLFILLFISTAFFAIFLYQTKHLEYPAFSILYNLRFYFGVIPLFLSLYLFLNSCNLNPNQLYKLQLNLIESAIVLNFAMGLCDVLFPLMGYGPTPWIPPIRLSNFLFFKYHLGIPRAYGFTGNAAVFGAFSLFLTTFYFACIYEKPSKKNLLVLFCGALSIILSQSGTGFLLSLVTFFAITFFTLKNKLIRPYLILIALAILISAIIGYKEFSPTGRYSFSGIKHLYLTHGQNVLAFASGMLKGKSLHALLGCFNFNAYDFQQIHNQTIFNHSSLYDFTYLAMFLEVGILGLLAYFFFFYYFISKAFSKKSPLKKFSFLLLLLSSLHYGASFWICSQIMTAALLSINLYLKEATSVCLYTPIPIASDQ